MQRQVGIACGVIVAAAFGLAGCESTPKPQPSGYLTGGYSELTPTKSDHTEQIRSPRLEELAAAQSFCVAEPKVLAEKLNEAQKGRLRDDLRHALEKELAKDKPVTPEGTAGCALVRSGITGVEKANVTENFAIGVLSPLPVMPSTGALVVEAEALSPVDQHQIAAILWAERGSPFSFFQALKPTGHAQALTRDFAKRLAFVLNPEVQAKAQGAASPANPEH